MSARWTLADVKALQSRGQVKSSSNKYNAKRTQVDGWWFDSKLEAARYDELKTLRRAGELLWFLCQVPFRLPGGIIYRADFLNVWRERVTVEDCKGAMTRTSLNKIKQVEEIYGIKIELITRSNVRCVTPRSTPG